MDLRTQYRLLLQLLEEARIINPGDNPQTIVIPENTVLLRMLGEAEIPPLAFTAIIEQAGDFRRDQIRLRVLEQDTGERPLPPIGRQAWARAKGSPSASPRGTSVSAETARVGINARLNALNPLIQAAELPRDGELTLPYFSALNTALDRYCTYLQQNNRHLELALLYTTMLAVGYQGISLAQHSKLPRAPESARLGIPALQKLIPPLYIKVGMGIPPPTRTTLLGTPIPFLVAELATVSLSLDVRLMETLPLDEASERPEALETITRLSKTADATLHLIRSDYPSRTRLTGQTTKIERIEHKVLDLQARLETCHTALDKAHQPPPATPPTPPPAPSTGTQINPYAIVAQHIAALIDYAGEVLEVGSFENPSVPTITALNTVTKNYNMWAGAQGFTEENLTTTLQMLWQMRYVLKNINRVGHPQDGKLQILEAIYPAFKTKVARLYQELGLGDLAPPTDEKLDNMSFPMMVTAHLVMGISNDYPIVESMEATHPTQTAKLYKGFLRALDRAEAVLAMPMDNRTFYEPAIAQMTQKIGEYREILTSKVAALTPKTVPAQPLKTPPVTKAAPNPPPRPTETPVDTIRNLLRADSFEDDLAWWDELLGELQPTEVKTLNQWLATHTDFMRSLRFAVDNVSDIDWSELEEGLVTAIPGYEPATPNPSTPHRVLVAKGLARVRAAKGLVERLV